MQINDETKKIAMATTTFIAILVFSIYGLDNFTLSYQEQNFDANSTVLNHTEAENKSLGLDAGSKLNYGNLPQETNATKFVAINSSDKVIVSIGSEGNISEHLYYEDSHYFQGYQNIGLEFRAMQPGNFTGDINVEVVTSQNGVGDYWIRFRGDYWPFSHAAENARNRLDLALYRLGV